MLNLVFFIMIASLSYAFFITGRDSIEAIRNILRFRKIKHTLMAVKDADEVADTCEHKWSESHVKLATSEGYFQNYVCMKCGRIAGTDYMVNGPGLEAIEEQEQKVKALEAKKRLTEQRIQIDLNYYMHDYIKAYKLEPEASKIKLYHEYLLKKYEEVQKLHYRDQ